MSWALRKQITLPFNISFDNRLGWLYRRMSEILSYQFNKLNKKNGPPIEMLVYSNEENEEFLDSWVRTAKFLEAINLYAQELEAQFMVFGVCTKEQIYPEQLLDRYKNFPEIKCQLDPNHPQNRLVKILNNFNIQFIDLFPGFNESCQVQKGDLFYKEDIHWNEKGHTKAAETLAKNVLDFIKIKTTLKIQSNS